MLLTVISALGGALINVLPTVVAYFIRREETVQQRDKYEHEINKARLQGEMNIAVAEAQLKSEIVVANTEADIAEGAAIRAADAASTNNGFWAAVRTSVRPVITYTLFASFVGIKGFSFYYATFILDYDILIALDYIWDPETQAIFAAIIGFWFGSRAIEKFTRNG